MLTLDKPSEREAKKKRQTLTGRRRGTRKKTRAPQLHVRRRCGIKAVVSKYGISAITNCQKMKGVTYEAEENFDAIPFGLADADVAACRPHGLSESCLWCSSTRGQKPQGQGPQGMRRLPLTCGSRAVSIIERALE